MKNKQLFLASSIMIALMGTNAAFAAVDAPQKDDVWYQDAQTKIAEAKANLPINKPAKNVILFVGDGMSIGTITAARIFEGQRKGMTGEEYRLTMETLPNVALSKTYNTNAQTPDSAGTATAMVSGVKTKSGVISVDDNVQRGFCNTVKGNETKSAWEMAAEKGLSVGVISTARITHATPATVYAHSADRDWENDAAMPNIAKDQGCIDIAQQLVNFDHGHGLQVMFGGGRSQFLPDSVKGEEGKSGKRKDGHNLIEEWKAKNSDGQYVWNKEGFDKLDSNTKRAFGLFEPSHMQYEADRTDEPSLAEMTSKAIDILGNNKDGFLLMVEAGRIDHAHHDTNAARALADTVAMDDAIKAALDKTNPEETLIIVTADHAHTFILNGYSDRGNNILGLAKQGGKFAEDEFGKRYTTISYGNGMAAVDGARSNPTEDEVTAVDYKQQALIKFTSETHSPEDVAIFAKGPQAYLFQGAVEQNYIYHVINEALQLAK